MRYSIYSLGCKVNRAEAEKIEEGLQQGSHLPAGSKDTPDICVVNTCTVTAKSSYESRQAIRRAIKTGARVYVTGCYSELYPDEIRGMGSMVEIIPSRNKNIINQTFIDKSYSNTLNFYRRSRPLIKIQDGCDSACSYCIVPRARGNSVSIGMGEIVDEAVRIESLGYNEAVLTGVHIGQYGRDLPSVIDLSGLIEAVLAATDRIRIRLSSIEPNEIDDRLLGLLKEERVCRHIHIPLQSGDDRILESMNRRYRCGQCREVVMSVYNAVEGISIGADVIVGFPAETDEQFKATYEFIRGLPLTYLHVFPYSRRPMTAADSFDGHLPKIEKSRRAQILKALSAELSDTFRRSQIGKRLYVIVEDSNDGLYHMTSDNYLRVYLDKNDYRLDKRSLIEIEIVDEFKDGLTGIPLNIS